VVGVIEAQVVEPEQRFLRRAATQVRPAREVQAGDARQPLDGADGILADVRQGFERHGVEYDRRQRGIVAEAVMARAHDHRLDGRRSRPAGHAGMRMARRFRLLAHEHQGVPGPARERDAVRRQDLRQQRLRVARARLALDAHPGLDEVAAVEEFEAVCAQLAQDLLDRQAAVGRGRRGCRKEHDQGEERLHGSGTGLPLARTSIVSPSSAYSRSVVASIASSAASGGRWRMLPCRITAAARSSTAGDS
jgi:hypothetical protein